MYVAAILISDESSVGWVRHHRSCASAVGPQEQKKNFHTWTVHVDENVRIPGYCGVLPSNYNCLCAEPLSLPNFFDKFTLPSLNQRNPVVTGLVFPSDT